MSCVRKVFREIVGNGDLQSLHIWSSESTAGSDVVSVLGSRFVTIPSTDDLYGIESVNVMVGAC